MRTGRSLIVCCSLLPGGGGSAWSGGGGSPWFGGGGGSPWSGDGVLPGLGGFSLVRGGPGRGVLLGPGGGSPWSGGCLPGPVNRITDTCKNITLATTSLRPLIKHNSFWNVFVINSFEMLPINRKHFTWEYMPYLSDVGASS